MSRSPTPRVVKTKRPGVVPDVADGEVHGRATRWPSVEWGLAPLGGAQHPVPGAQALFDGDVLGPAQAQGQVAPLGPSVLVDEGPGPAGRPDQEPLGQGQGIGLAAGLDEDLGPLPYGPVRRQLGDADIDQEFAGLAVGLATQAGDGPGIVPARLGAEADACGLAGGQGRGGGLVHPGPDPELVQGDDLHQRGPGHQHVAGVAVAADDEPIVRGPDLGEGELLLAVEQGLLGHEDLALGLGDGGMGAGQIGLGDAQARGGLVHVRLGGGPGRHQPGGALVIQARQGEHGLGAGQIGPDPLGGLARRAQGGVGHGDLLAGLRIVQPGEDLPRLHLVALVRQHQRQALLDARPDGGAQPRLQGAGAHDLADHGPARHDMRGDRFRGQLEPVESQPGHDDERGSR